MFEFLLYTEISCKDLVGMLDRIAKHDQLTKRTKIELIEVIQEASPHCYGTQTTEGTGKTDPGQPEKVQFHPTSGVTYNEHTQPHS